MGFWRLSTFEDFYAALMSSNPWKAVGFDGISMALLYYGPESLHRAVYKFIYFIETFNVFPKLLTQAKVIPILKKEPAEH